MSTIIKDKKELIAKLRKTASVKNAFDGSMPKDPNETPVSATPEADHDNKNMSLPKDQPNKDGEHDKQVNEATKGTPDKIAKPSVSDGNAEDDKGTAELKSLAKSAADIVAALKNKNKTVSEAVKKEATESKTAEEVASSLAEGFTPEFHLKLASVILSTEEGKAFANEIVKREKGIEAAAIIVKAAAQQAELDKIAEARQREEMEKQAYVQELENVWSTFSKEDQDSIVKLATAHNVNTNKLTSDIEKAAYDAGAADAAAVMDSEESGQPLPVEGEETSIEDIVMVLEQLVASGQITPEDAQAILEAFLGEQGGVPADVDPAMAEEAAAMEAVPEMGKVASVVESLLK